MSVHQAKDGATNEVFPIISLAICDRDWTHHSKTEFDEEPEEIVQLNGMACVFHRPWNTAADARHPERRRLN